MQIIVNKQNAPIIFSVGKKDVVIEGNSVLNYISDDDWAYIYTKWRKFIDKNTFCDKNPSGYFVLQAKKENAEAQAKELAVNDAEDKGRQMTLTEAVTLEFENMTAKELKSYANENKIAVSGNKKAILQAIVKAEVEKREAK